MLRFKFQTGKDQYGFFFSQVCHESPYQEIRTRKGSSSSSVNGISAGFAPLKVVSCYFSDSPFTSNYNDGILLTLCFHNS